MADEPGLLDDLIDLDPRIRHVALSLDGGVQTRVRADLESIDGSEPEKQEDLLVSPEVLELVRRPGNARGGARYVVIRYGDFWELAMACRGGHISIGIDLGGDPLDIAAEVSDILLRNGR